MRLLIALALAVLAAAPLRAWDAPTHSEIARLALGGEPSLSQTVTSETLDDYLAATGQGGAAAFIARLRLNPSTSFGFKAPGEVAGAAVPAIDVLSTYVNEPDWGMDQGICAAYPGTCAPDLKFMGAFEKGLPSQAFRHMYWPTGYIKIFKKLLPIPIHEDKPIGEAPRRCQLFFDMSLAAARAGHPYWAMRFLAWSMHYAQDVTQPFHAAQLPSRSLMGTSHLLPSMSRTVKKLSYYHLAFEDYMDGLLDGQAGLGATGQDIQARLGASIARSGTLPQTTAEAVAKAAAAHSISESFAKRTADAAMKFFPRLPDIDHADVEAFIAGDAFKQEMTRRSQPGPLLDEFVAIASSCLGEGGAASRALLALYARRMRAPLVAARPRVSTAALSARLRAMADALAR